MVLKITIIGSGNVATHLGIALKAAGHNIVEVYSKNIRHATALASKLNAIAIDDLTDLSSHNGLYLFSISDNAYSDMLPKFPYQGKLIAHTAGSIPSAILQEISGTYGVIYPFQSFTKNKAIDMQDIPILICASDAKTEQTFVKLAKSISNKVSLSTDEQRGALHICAVFACNFTNHMYCMAETLANENNIDFSLLYPLIKETAEKAMSMSPKKGQTGPAVRQDTNVINKHLGMLNSNDTLKEWYQILSQSIINYHHNDGTKKF